MRFLKICIFCIVFLALGITLVNVADLQKTNTNLNNQITQQEQTYSGKIDELTVYQEKLVERISLLEENYQKLQTAYDELKAAYDQYILDATIEREQLQTTVTSLNATITELEQNSDVKEETIAELRAEVLTLEASLENQTTTANELQATVTQQEVTIAELNTTIDTLVAELNSDLKTIQLAKFQDLFVDDESIEVTLTADDLGNITSIREYAFYNCKNLVSVEIPNTCVYIENFAFGNCTNITEVTFEENSQLETICNTAFSSVRISSLILPEGLKTIEANAFPNCVNLSSVYLPETLETLSSQCFNGARISTIYIPASVITINTGMLKHGFLFKSSLEEVTIYCAAIEIPDSWGSNWNEISSGLYASVHYGYTYEDYLEAISA